MADLIREMPVAYEPLMTNRWVVRTQESFQNIPEWVVADFKIDTVDVKDEKISRRKKRDNKALRLTLHFRNMVNWLLTPDDVMCAEKVTIDFLDPTGVKVNHYDMEVEFDNLTLVGDYSDLGILTHEVTFWIKGINTFSGDNLEKEVFKKYTEKQEGGE